MRIRRTKRVLEKVNRLWPSVEVDLTPGELLRQWDGKPPRRKR